MFQVVVRVMYTVGIKIVTVGVLKYLLQCRLIMGCILTTFWIQNFASTQPRLTLRTLTLWLLETNLK